MTVQKKHRLQTGFFCLVALAGFFAAPAFSEGKALSYRVLRSLPHDPRHFTQGLIFHQGRLYESAGGYGASALYEKNLRDGRVLREHRFSREIFAEGLSLLGNELFVLSWRNGVGFVFDTAFNESRRLRYRGEGWGLTTDGASLIMSDGSPRLRWLEPATWKLQRDVAVRDGERSISQLNELEYAHGLVFANVWYSDRIAVIAPSDGQVRGWLDLSTLRQQINRIPGADDRENVLNGIAHDADRDVFYVTGKRWPLLFELEIALPEVSR